MYTSSVDSMSRMQGSKGMFLETWERDCIHALGEIHVEDSGAEVHVSGDM